jgi:hypothetical protein
MRLVFEAQGREGHRRLEPLAKGKWQVRHLGVAAGAARCPLPDL